MTSFEGEDTAARPAAKTDTIDTTTDAGMAALQGLGISVTRR